jgi:hypothetical protein
VSVLREGIEGVTEAEKKEIIEALKALEGAKKKLLAVLK